MLSTPGLHLSPSDSHRYLHSEYLLHAALLISAVRFFFVVAGRWNGLEISRLPRSSVFVFESLLKFGGKFQTKSFQKVEVIDCRIDVSHRVEFGVDFAK